ncbi:hypothetical protein ACEPPN_004510 [Leptodophora sp. 'Broadleaf-Isolate-01']
MPSSKFPVGNGSAPVEEKIAPSLTAALTMVKIIISKGEDKKEYQIYQEFATYHSPVLKDAFESGQKSCTISDMSPDLFGNIQCWMYTGELCGPDNRILLPAQLCRLWIGAAFLQMPRLQNFVMGKLFGNKSMDIIAVSRIYEMTKGDPKNLINDICTAWEDNARLLRAAIAKGNTFDKKDPKKLRLEDYLVEEPKL